MEDRTLEQTQEKQKTPKKQINFRAPEDVTAWIEQQREKTGRSKEEIILDALNDLILKRAQEAFPSRQVETAEFELHLNAIQRMYVASIDMCENAEARVREEFAKELDRTKGLLDEKIEQIKGMKEQLVELVGATDKAKQLQKELDAASEQARRDRLDFEERLADKTRALKDADTRLVIAETKAAEYDALKADRDALNEQLRAANEKITAMTKEHEVELEREGRKADQAKAEAVATAKAAAQTQIDSLKDQVTEARIAGEKAVQEALKTAAEDLRKAVHEAEEKAHTADKAAAEALLKKQIENDTLREQVTELQKQLEELRAKADKK